MLKTYLAVMAGGAVGVAGRLFIGNYVTNHYGDAFPWGTFLVNIIGCFIIGIFTGLIAPDGPWSASALTQQIIVIGILGGFTTFSTFSLQTISLLTKGNLTYAFANVFLTVILCFLGTWGGLMFSHFWQTK